MKGSIHIIFIFLAVFFCSKDLIILSGTFSDSSSYVVDLNEEESQEQDEKSDIDEKDDIEKWHQGAMERILAAESVVETIFHNHQEKSHFIPYFEVFSPPPELI